MAPSLFLSGSAAGASRCNNGVCPKPSNYWSNLLDLERIEVNTFRGRHPEEERQRTFGGQVAAQALMAAGRTVEFGSVHSLHSYFLRPGDPTIPILYEVDRIRDGKSFTTRRVVAIQHGKAIYNMQASFHTEEESLEHQFEMPDASGARDRSADSPIGSKRRAATRRVVQASAPDRPTFRRRTPVESESQQGTRTSRSGSRPTANCPTTRCCTPVSSPTRVT